MGQSWTPNYSSQQQQHGQLRSDQDAQVFCISLLRLQRTHQFPRKNCIPFFTLSGDQVLWVAVDILNISRATRCIITYYERLTIQMLPWWGYYAECVFGNVTYNISSRNISSQWLHKQGGINRRQTPRNNIWTRTTCVTCPIHMS